MENAQLAASSKNAMPHLRELPKPRCQCGKPATVEAYNYRNAPCGHFCKKCGNGWLKRNPIGLIQRSDATG